MQMKPGQAATTQMKLGLGPLAVLAALSCACGDGGTAGAPPGGGTGNPLPGGSSGSSGGPGDGGPAGDAGPGSAAEAPCTLSPKAYGGMKMWLCVPSGMGAQPAGLVVAMHGYRTGPDQGGWDPVPSKTASSDANAVQDWTNTAGIWGPYYSAKFFGLIP